ncbi:unnamed protein product [Chondrus crispus]|uniref:Uncharacterized protein n=1 Tax=Chondrus crispus TaxID=2769 RepID=R7Q762_CHOCR|nr:unnamed protein product [Chondrus crispus]CDF33221.1 unnamed protein product [Chondrus crispus]|eukprot:XP_005713024.1 unnamed protein product [Chondrus crispus]
MSWVLLFSPIAFAYCPTQSIFFSTLTENETTDIPICPTPPPPRQNQTLAQFRKNCLTHTPLLSFIVAAVHEKLLSPSFASSSKNASSFTCSINTRAIEIGFKTSRTTKSIINKITKTISSKYTPATRPCSDIKPAIPFSILSKRTF